MPHARRTAVPLAIAWLAASSLLLGGIACSSRATGSGVRKNTRPPAAATSTDTTPTRPALCSRVGDDAVRDVFCGETPAAISSLAELQAELQMTPGDDPYSSGGLTGATAVLLGHSTSLSGHVVSPINPRVILPGDQSRLLMAFQRGVQRAEIAATNRGDGVLNLYLLTFRQACNQAKNGCLPGDLYTPAIETGWTSVEVEDAEDLKNTPSDCRQCHQRGRDTPALLMRELEGPWTHFFGPESDDPDDGSMKAGITGGLLAYDYRMAKGDEPYAGVPIDSIEHTTGFALEVMMQAQPLLFDAPTIVGECFPYVENTTWPGPLQRSPTWDREYGAFKRGEHLALPYFATLATDPDKLSRLTDAYQSYLAGTTAAEALPDFADVFPDDPQVRAEIGLQTEPDASPAEALIQACGSCHNDVLDQSISRARFNIGLSKLDPAELAIAIDRLSRSRGEAGAMPPDEARQLAPAVRDRLVQYLKKAEFSDSDSAMLTTAAMLGMAGGADGATQ